MTKKYIIFLLSLLILPFFLAAQITGRKLKSKKDLWVGIPQAENVRLEQKILENTIEVYYDLPEDLGKAYIVRFELYQKSDKNVKIMPKTVSGKVGLGYFSGKNNKIVWDYLIDYPDGLPSALDYYVKVYVIEAEADIPALREQKRRATEWHAAVLGCYNPFPNSLSILGAKGMLRLPIGKKLSIGLQANYLISNTFQSQNYFLLDNKERNEFQMNAKFFSLASAYLSAYYKIKQRLLKDEWGLQLSIPVYSMATFHFTGKRTRYLNMLNGGGNAFYQKDSVWNVENGKISGSMNDFNLGLYYRKLLNIKRNIGFFSGLNIHFYPKQSFRASQTDAIFGNLDKSKYNQILTGTLFGTNEFSQENENAGTFKTRTAPFWGASVSIGVTF